MIAVRDHLELFGDAAIAVVSFAPPSSLANYRRYLELPFDVVADPNRVLYRLLGAERATLRQAWSVGTIRLYVRLIRAGRRLRWPTEDILQLGADAVIGPDGVIRYLSLPSTPAGRPPLAELVAALKEVAK